MGRPTNAERDAKLASQDKQPEFVAIETPEDVVLAMQQQVDKLEEALSRIAHVTGSFNYISGLGIKRWVPGKEHMGKKYA